MMCQSSSGLAVAIYPPHSRYFAQQSALFWPRKLTIAAFVAVVSFAGLLVSFGHLVTTREFVSLQIA